VATIQRIVHIRRIVHAIGTVAPLLFAPDAVGAGVLWVWNATGASITVNVDGIFGCNTSAGSQCTIPVADGSHKAIARAADPSYEGALQRDFIITNDTHRWCIFADDDPSAKSRCEAWTNQGQ